MSRRSPHTTLALACCALCLSLARPAAAAGESAGEALSYRIRLGDTLIGIGEKLLRQPADWVKVQRLNHVREPRRLQPDSILHIPFDLLRVEPISTEVVQTVGRSQSRGQPLSAGGTLPPSSEVETGEDGYVTLRLADGSLLTLQPRSRAKVGGEAVAGAGSRRSVVTLIDGRADVRAKKGAPGDRHEVRTPAAVLSVRGTRYRVATEETSAVTRAEVTEGSVALSTAGRGERALERGFGAVMRPGEPAAVPVVLLPQPDLGSIAQLHERTTLRLQVGRLDDAIAYRLQIARDADFAQTLAEQFGASPEIKLAAPPDGEYWLRARGVDRHGLEGLDATVRITIHARPEPPFASRPPPNADVVEGVDAIAFEWSAAEGAARYRLQIADDPEFRRVRRDLAQLAATSAGPGAALEPGTYYWRLASIAADGRAGPFGDPQRFVLRRAPPVAAPPQVADDTIGFSWPGEAPQRFEFQLARDAAFGDLLVSRELSEPTVRLPRPQEGTYYMRVRGIEPDGFVGPYSATQRIDVPAQPPQLWWLLPLLLVPLL